MIAASSDELRICVVRCRACVRPLDTGPGETVRGVADRTKDMIVRSGFNVYPRFVEFREDFPMTTTGKVFKRELD